MTGQAEGVLFLTGKDFASGGAASSSLKKTLEQIGIKPEIVRRVAIAAFEAEMNVIIYAVAGMMSYYITPDSVKVVVKDMGQGIPDIEKAMQEGYSTAPDYIREMGFGSGMGLPNIKKNSDEFRLESAVGEGTTVEFVMYLKK